MLKEKSFELDLKGKMVIDRYRGGAIETDA